MTDNEIIKALKFCSEDSCNNCPAYDEKIGIEECATKLSQNALDLINRQQAEIERYLHSIKLLENDVATAKSEAIKEFVERLKDSADKTRIRNLGTEKIIFYTDELKLDKLIKKMTEVNENDRA